MNYDDKGDLKNTFNYFIIILSNKDKNYECNQSFLVSDHSHPVLLLEYKR